MELTSLIACICEGGAEKTIMKILLDNDLLIFRWTDLLEEELLTCRNGEKFESYLRKAFFDKISVVRILDSRREKFKVGKAYEHKIEVVNVITAPEIEMLVIRNEGKYNEYKKSGKKPSDFCKQDLKMSQIKSPSTVEKYFSNVDDLVASIKEYGRITKARSGEYMLADLLKP